MNNYYIVKHQQGSESRLIQIVERRMGELDNELTNRCLKIIDSIRPVGSDADYCFYDRHCLNQTNLEHIKREVFG
tara:strand:- start:314 stop:538 length:225 start_codon:yes stop_codon:yes gene_type:complete